MSMMGNSWSAMRSFSRDESVKDRAISRATALRVLTFAGPYRGAIIAFLITLVVDSLLVVGQPLLFRRIFDVGIAKHNAGVVTVSAALVALIAIVGAGLALVERWYSARIGEGLILDLRRQVYAHVQRQPIAFFTRTQTGALVSRLNNDVIGAQQAFTSTLSGVVGNLISLGIVATTMFVLSWQITLASLMLVPLFVLPARVMGRRIRSLTKEAMVLNAEMSTQMTERFNVAGALLVKLFGRPREEDAMFSARASRVRDIGVRSAMANRVFFISLTLVAAMATALVYGIGGNFVVSGRLSAGTLLALATLLSQLYGPLTALSNVRIDIMTALVSFERVFEVLDLPRLVNEAPNAVAIKRGPTAIQFSNVRFRYPSAAEVSLASLESVARPESAPSEEVLRGVTFEVAPGQLVALVGPSGAGKTTITSLVSRLYDVNEGAVRLGGQDVRGITFDSLHEVVGVVTQDAHMFHDTIRSNLTYAQPGASDEQLMQACDEAAIGDMMRSLPDGLDTVVGDRGYRLSGGEKQRLALARLLLKAPDVVILDEATAHLDSESEAAVQRALAVALAGRTSLVIAHRLSTVRDADLILVIDNGVVRESGTHEELLAQGGLYRDLYRTQFAGQAAAPEPIPLAASTTE